MNDSMNQTQVTPSIRPATLLIITTSILTFVVVVGIYTAKIGRQVTNFLIIGVVLVGLIIIIRSVVEIFILSRTNYIITDEHLRREFHLFYRVREREVPLEQLRGIELTRGVLQSLLGYGDLRFLTGGTNQSLGFIKFERIPDPEKHRNRLRNILENSGKIEQKSDSGSKTE